MGRSEWPGPSLSSDKKDEQERTRARDKRKAITGPSSTRSLLRLRLSNSPSAVLSPPSPGLEHGTKRSGETDQSLPRHHAACNPPRNDRSQQQPLARHGFCNGGPRLRGPEGVLESQYFAIRRDVERGEWDLADFEMAVEETEGAGVECVGYAAYAGRGGQRGVSV